VWSFYYFFNRVEEKTSVLVAALCECNMKNSLLVRASSTGTLSEFKAESSK
jgi:hypothetical protein